MATGKRIHSVYIDLVDSTDVVHELTPMAGFVLDDINTGEVSYAPDQFEGLFDFYFPEFRFGLRGDWLSGVNHPTAGHCVIDQKFRKVKIVRDGKDFFGFIAPDSILRRELCPGFHVTEITVLSFASGLKLSPLGKISSYEDVEHPERTFSLFRKTVEQVPYDVAIPSGKDPEDFKFDVDIYIRPELYYEPNALVAGDKAEFHRVDIFDTETLSNDIANQANPESRQFYKPVTNRFYEDTAFEAYYSYGVKAMPIVPISEIVQHGLICANRFFALSGANWPTFTVGSADIPPQVVIRDIAILTGAWHFHYMEFQSRKFGFVWREQFEVEIFEITNRTQVTSLGSYTYSQWPGREWTDGRRGVHIGDSGLRGITTQHFPQRTWESVRSDRLRNPQRYGTKHPDADMYATVFGTSADEIFFGWWMNRHGVGEYTGGYYRIESTIWMHAVSINVVTGVIRAQGGPTIENVANQHFYDDQLLTRWSVAAREYGGREGVYTYPLHSDPDVNSHRPIMTGSNTFFMQETQYADYFDQLETDQEWCRFILRFPPHAGDYVRSAYSVLYTGLVGSSELALYLENMKVSDLIVLICKLTNSLPVIETGAGMSTLSFKQRRLPSELYEENREADYTLGDASILHYETRSENYSMKESGVVIELDLENTPDTVREAFSDFYEEEYLPNGFNLHLIDVPLAGDNMPTWAHTIVVGNTISVRGKVLEYLGMKKRYLDATLVLEER